MLRKTVLAVLFGVVVLALGACSQASLNRTFDYGTQKLIVSNGGPCVAQIYVSKGRVEDASESDGYYFNDLRTGVLTQVSGDTLMRDASAEQIRVYTAASTDKQAGISLLAQVIADGSILPESAQCQRPE